jgi:hypothetical protein
MLYSARHSGILLAVIILYTIFKTGTGTCLIEKKGELDDASSNADAGGTNHVHHLYRIEYNRCYHRHSRNILPAG